MPSSLFPFYQSSEDASASAWNLSTFFWYFPARNNPKNAPLSLYLAGGPGESSVFTAATDSGPCIVNPDSNSTSLNPWSYNNHVNMLYIDQPNFAGYSYDEITEGHYDVISGAIIPGPGEANATFWPGKWGTQQIERIAHTTQNSAKVMYEVVQALTADLPGLQDKPISAWGNSYGGYSAPATLAEIQRQNEALQAGGRDSKRYHHIQVDTLGLLNGCVDLSISMFSYPEMANNNTYGVKLLPQEVYESSKNNLTKDGGCLQALERCQQLGYEGDPAVMGLNQTVNDFCGFALTQNCLTEVEIAFMAVTGRASFDISHPLADPEPHMFAAGFFNQEWVQNDLGAAVNFNWAPDAVTNSYLALGDSARQNISNIEYLLDGGVKVALVHGDRDYVCNWIGGEAIALAAKYNGSETFRSSGYVPIATNSSYEGGVVKQAGRFSFARVFQAGHAPAFFQPETIHSIFNRTMFNNDVATGKEDLTKNPTYVTDGPTDSWGWTDTLPPPPENMCNLWAPAGTCTEEQLQALALGNATVTDTEIITSPGGLPVLPPQNDKTTSSNGNSTGTSGGGGAASSSASNSGAAGNMVRLSIVSLIATVGTSFYLGTY
ncbi:uncharacterized protein A1O9_06827 [Exophiala aquamarina CBS 119918]|uniref:Carboxypeptidase D n=1 Tax=Exophiala aquamarina CBS 119918 TaxID=1182545 RepID=A0A072PBJ3_9EURO|nr:uncharacterized protein A1O9_06827 [Exophiala aquamarina CBS 119918]KEF56638.1 hypothetical protein A1O9_06827 [Exophiala aquamarina CBS 119918]